LAEAYYGLGDYLFASRCYNSLLKFAKTPAEQKNIQAKLARSLYFHGEKKLAWNIIVVRFRLPMDFPGGKILQRFRLDRKVTAKKKKKNLLEI